ncbi:hypothetical protein CspeluHIS016_0505730 [Cutaneotrichosporon spelunceum]|uniref:Uncharacterized protein n=1 Tax=Cutaneotrichosporon spelunceum TaxID=1672016 RepID=A0AAD3TX80_9TREE|nr:hypothetical protein CspeluHIS016_0505730 [Cutaneotrichosporon spelunceum]
MSTTGGYFLALAAAELYTLQKKIFTLDGFKLAAPSLRTGKCFAQPGAHRYPLLGQYLDGLNCLLNSVFMAAHESSDAQLLMASVVAVLFSSLMVSTYESFRPTHRNNGVLGFIARCSSFFYVVGQIMTAGFAMPLHAAFCVWSHGISKKNKHARPEGKYAWSTLLSVAIGFLLPSLGLAAENMSYRALSVWQLFPFYILALNLVLSRILPKAPRSRAVAIIAVLCTVVSVSCHIGLLRELSSGRRLGDILLFDTKWTTSLTYAAHALFAVDAAFMLITSASVVLLPYKAKLGVLIAMLIITLAAGPGAAIILPWAYHELSTE